MSDRAPPAANAPRRRQGVAGGLAYTLVANYAVRFVNLGVTIAVARAVGPDAMGIVAAALLTVEIIDTLRDLGVREALIYQPGLGPASLNSAFAVILGVATLQAAAMLALGLFGPGLGMESALGPVLIGLALLFPLAALGTPQESLLQRQGDFAGRAMAEVAGVVVKASVALTLLYLGWGIQSVVAGMLAGMAARSAALWLRSTWRLGPVWPQRDSALRLLGFGRHIIAVNIMALCRLKVDQYVIAAVLGPAALGLYFLAARIPEIVIFGVNVAITTVAYPTFARILRGGGSLHQAYVRTVRASMVLLAPIAIGVAAISDQVVLVLFGTGWQGSATVLAILSLGGIPLTLGWSAGDVFKATGRPELLTRVTLIEVLVTAPAVAAVVVLTGNLAWIAVTMVAFESAACALRLVFLKRYQGFEIRPTLRAVAPGILCALLMGACVLGIGQATLGLGPVLRLGIAIATGAVSYAAFLALLDKPSLAEARAWRRERAAVRRAGSGQ